MSDIAWGWPSEVAKTEAWIRSYAKAAKAPMLIHKAMKKRLVEIGCDVDKLVEERVLAVQGMLRVV